MKNKIIYSVFTALLVLGFTSCKENYDYTCKCKFDDGQTYNTSHYNGVTQQEAESSCAAQENVNLQMDTLTSGTVTCALE